MTAENITQSIDSKLADNEKEMANLAATQTVIETKLAELRAESDKLASVRTILVGSNDAAPVATKSVAKPKSAKKSKTAKAAKSPRTKLTQEVADQIRAAEGSHASIARYFGVSRQTVSNIKQGKVWAPDKPVAEFKAGLSAKATRRGKLTQETADAIRSAEGTIKAIAQTYSVSPTTVNNIRKGRIWPAL